MQSRYDEAAERSAEFDAFFSGYLTCALWSSTDDDGTPLDSGRFGDLDETCAKRLETEAREFFDANYADLNLFVAEDSRGARFDPWECAGHDFWLTRNGHGVGFWDRGLGDLGDRLTTASKAYGAADLYVGDDGKIYAHGYEVG